MTPAGSGSHRRRSLPGRARGVLRRADAVLARIEARVGPALEEAPIAEHLSTVGPDPAPLATTPARGQPGVTVLGSFHPGAVFGGTATLLALGAHLAERTGRRLRVVETVSHRDAVDISALLTAAGAPLPAHGVELVDVSWRRHRTLDPLPLHPREAVVTSAWWDSALAATLPLDVPLVQLVQDDEEIFYPSGDDALAASRTFDLPGTVPLFNTGLLREQMLDGPHRALAERGASFEPAVLRPSALPGSPGGGKERTIFFYARPQVARNLYATGLQALDLAAADPALQGWTLVMAGTPELPTVRLSGGARIENLGRLATGTYREVIGRCAVALSPMLAPHPNYPTLEFAQAGARVVTTRWRGKRDLSRYGADIAVVAPEARSLADAVIDACRHHDAGLPLRPAPPLPRSWAEAFEPVLPLVVEAVT